MQRQFKSSGTANLASELYHFENYPMPLPTGEFLTTGQAEAWLKEKHLIEIGKNSIYYQLKWWVLATQTGYMAPAPVICFS